MGVVRVSREFRPLLQATASDQDSLVVAAVKLGDEILESGNRHPAFDDE
jgi:hypothetical protein